MCCCWPTRRESGGSSRPTWKRPGPTCSSCRRPGTRRPTPASESVIEFGGLDDAPAELPPIADAITTAKDASPAEDPLPQSAPVAETPEDPETFEQLRQIQRLLADVQADFQPAATTGPEVETVFETPHPFRETFEEEEVIADRYAAVPPPDFFRRRAHRHAACPERTDAECGSEQAMRRSGDCPVPPRLSLPPLRPALKVRANAARNYRCKRFPSYATVRSTLDAGAEVRPATAATATLVAEPPAADPAPGHVVAATGVWTAVCQVAAGTVG